MSRQKSENCILFFGIGAALLVQYYPVLDGKLLFARDLSILSIPDAALMRQCLERGEWPLWNPFQRLGMPFLATIQSQALYPFRTMLLLLLDAPRAVTASSVLHAVVLCTGTYSLCRQVGRSRAASGLSSMSVSIAPMFCSLAAQNLSVSFSWTPWLAITVIRLGRQPSASKIAMLAIFTSLSFLAGSPEVLLWQVLALLVLAAGPSTQRGRSVASTSAGLLWGALLSSIVLLPALELASEAIHANSSNERLTWSSPPVELLALALPGANLPRVGYFESDDESLLVSVFVGSIPVVLAAFGVFATKARWSARLAFAVAGGFFAVLALGKHFAPSAWLLEVPPFSMFRYPAKYLLAAGFFIPVLGSFGVDRITAIVRAGLVTRRRLALSVMALAVLTALGLALSRWLSMRSGVALGVAWGGVFVGAALALTGASARIRAAKRFAPWVLVMAATAELMLGAWLMPSQLWIGHQALAGTPAIVEALPRPFVSRISAPEIQPPSGRGGSAVGDALPVGDPRAALFPNRFIEFSVPALEGLGTPDPYRITRALSIGSRALYELAGVSHYIRFRKPPKLDLAVALPPASAGLPTLYSSARAWPRAFVAYRSKAASDDEAMEALARNAITPDEALLLGGPFLNGTRSASPARIVASELNAVTVDVDALEQGILVLTDSDYPGWEARVDGKPEQIFRAYGLVRAVPVFAGRHRVEFNYNPWTFRSGAVSSVVWLLVLCAVFARSLWLHLGKRLYRPFRRLV
jgi:hypothetical protein